MKVQEASKQILTVVESLLLIGERAISVAKSLSLLHPDTPPFSYENLSLDFKLDLNDPTGRLATITRKQRVHFLTNEAGVLSSPIWGDGVKLKRLVVEGANRLGSRPEGLRDVVLLGLQRAAEKDTITSVVSHQTVSNAFLRKEEYFEAVVERPTKRLSLKAIFPKGRPPRDSYVSISSSQHSLSLPVRLGDDGRARLRWTVKNPTPETVYSMRWVW